MAPKRQRPLTPPRKLNGRSSASKKSKKVAQSSIDSFFTSPSKPRPAPNGTLKRDQSVISIVDSDDDEPILQSSPVTVAKGEDDASMARRLAQEWAKQDGAKSPVIDKGKRRASQENDASDEDIVSLETPFAQAPGINGSSSSTHRLPPGRSSSLSPERKPETVRSPKKEKEKVPLAPMFSKPKAKSPPRTPKKEEQLDELKPILTPTKGGTITSATAEPVDAIDFDTDAFLFRPEEVDTSQWPKGRLPYSILVGVYVQVSSTRSRLMIVRVLTKWVDNAT